MILLGLSGKRRSGKTTVANYLSEHFAWNHYSLAAPLKHDIRAMYNLTWDHTDGALKEVLLPAIGKTPRQLMCDYGKEKRDIDAMYWVKRLAEDMLHRTQAQFQWAVISDIRFQNEANWVKEHGGFMVRLNRSEVLTGPDIDDISETDLDSYHLFDKVFGESANVDMEDVPLIAHKIMSMIVNHVSQVA